MSRVGNPSNIWQGPEMLFSCLMVSFLLRKIFLGNLNEAISLVEIVSFRFPRKIFLKRKLIFIVDTGRKLNVHKAFRRRPERLMYVQFTSCVYIKIVLTFNE